MTWQQALKQAISDPKQLLQRLSIETQDLEPHYQACLSFPCRVPEAFVDRMQVGNPQDPLLLQVLPQGHELIQTPGYSDDPLGEAAKNPVPGLLHKYHGRALMILAGSCPINCRYCFRRHFPYQDNITDWQPALQYLQQHTDIHEIILSGGEPLLTSDEKLNTLIAQLQAIPHLRTLRIHTRMPIVIPQRITQALADMLKNTRLKVVMVLHCNHSQELDTHVAQALAKLSHVTLLNQSVLLKHINDSAQALIALSERLFELNILPYYLHLLDQVQGAAHFAVELATAQTLMREIHSKLPGYLVPKLAREEAGQPGKTHLN